jgi:hypothetical protein
MLPGIAELVMGKDDPLSKKDVALLEVIAAVYLQQKQMYENHKTLIKKG